MPQKIRILHIIPNLNPGGAENICYELLKNLPKDKFIGGVILFKDEDKNFNENSWINNLKNEGITIISQRKRFLFDFRNFYQLFKNIKKWQPDIVHTHLGGDIYGRLAAKFAKIPIIISTEHNLNKQEKIGARILKTISARFADIIVAVSLAVKKDAIKRYGLKDNKVKIIYNGIDLEKFKPETKKEKEQPLVFGSLGRLVPQKGFDVLLKAIPLTKRRDYLLKIGGAGKDKNILEKMIKDLKLQNRVSLLGQVEPISFLNSLDVFIISSYWEGFGLAAIEAGALKKPIIASKIDGLAEIITEKTGWSFKSESPLELAHQIDNIFENWDKEIINEKIEANYKNIEENFSASKMASDYINLYLSFAKKL